MLVMVPFVLLINGFTKGDWMEAALFALAVAVGLTPEMLPMIVTTCLAKGAVTMSKEKTIIKNLNSIQNLGSMNILCTDKTGTLTKGVFKVTEIQPQGNVSRDELITYAAFAESFSNHPIATSIVKAYSKEVANESIENYEEISGHGVKATVLGKEVLAGNYKLMNKENICYAQVDTIGTVVHVAVNKEYVGYIVISDEVKEDSAKAIKALKEIGVRKTVMLTGDNTVVGTKVAKQLGLDEVYSELLPDQKVEKVEALDKEKSSKGKLIFVGDGINDAPVLARADIGIAMGGVGSDAAIEAADVVIMTDEPSKIASAIKIAKKTRAIVMQNIIFALGIKAIILILVALGLGTMWEAVFGDVGVTLIAVLNSMRAMKTVQ